MKDIKQSNPLKRNTLGKSPNKTFFILGSGVILLFLDQILKQYFTAHSYYHSIFSLHFVKNTGMSFGLLPNTSFLMIIVSFLFLGMLWFFRKEFKECSWCIMFLVAGTLGNLIDRIFRGYVVDFFDLGWFPVFNLSDALITIGVIGLIWIFLMDWKKEAKIKKLKIKEKRKNKKKKQ